jgi:hypothetical protein
MLMTEIIYVLQQTNLPFIIIVFVSHSMPIDLYYTLLPLKHSIVFEFISLSLYSATLFEKKKKLFLPAGVCDWCSVSSQSWSSGSLTRARSTTSRSEAGCITRRR